MNRIKIFLWYAFMMSHCDEPRREWKPQIHHNVSHFSLSLLINCSFLGIYLVCFWCRSTTGNHRVEKTFQGRHCQLFGALVNFCWLCNSASDTFVLSALYTVSRIMWVNTYNTQGLIGKNVILKSCSGASGCCLNNKKWFVGVTLWWIHCCFSCCSKNI